MYWEVLKPYLLKPLSLGFLKDTIQIKQHVLLAKKLTNLTIFSLKLILSQKIVIFIVSLYISFGIAVNVP